MTTKSNIHLLETYPVQVQKDVIEVLEEALAKAREGEFKAVCICYVNKNDEAGRHWSMTADAAAMVGSLALAQARYIEELTHK